MRVSKTLAEAIRRKVKMALDVKYGAYEAKLNELSNMIDEEQCEKEKLINEIIEKHNKTFAKEIEELGVSTSRYASGIPCSILLDCLAFSSHRYIETANTKKLLEEMQKLRRQNNIDTWSISQEITDNILLDLELSGKKSNELDEMISKAVEKYSK